MNELFEVVTNDFVRTYAALAGFVISVINSIYLISVNSFKLSLIQKSFAFCDNHKGHPVYFELTIENKSRIPMSVSRMFLIINNQKYEFQWETERIGHFEFKTNGKVTEQYSTYSLTLPQNVSGMGAVGGFFFVPTDDSISRTDFLNSQLWIEIHSNRGRKKFKVDLAKLSDHP
ncbi:MAG: hypothetical protein J6A37_06995 [Oscillospiraceae bacterium]|nr:hypothetical protein [Oscillospiraceae bacterium]